MADHETEIAAMFQRETAHHQMTVLHDEGLYRHLRFRNPEHGCYWFDLVTWPGTLAIRGDIDGYMFSRVPDMFEFFRMHRTPVDGRLEINPSYWAQKVEGRQDITKRYSETLFRQHVIDDFKDAVKYGGVPQGLGRAIRIDVLDSPDAAFEEGAHQLLRDFRYGELHAGQFLDCTEKLTGQDDQRMAERWATLHRTNNPGHLPHACTEPKFTFSDAWEWDLRDYAPTFLWACHAIVWGIHQYDQVKAQAEPVGAAAGGDAR